MSSSRQRGGRAAQHRVERGGQRVHIGGRGRRRCRGGTVSGRRVRRGQHVQRERRVAGLGQHGQPEVGQRRLAEPGLQDVGRLHVAVQHAERVRVGQRVGDLHADVAHLDRRQRGAGHPVGVRAGAELHDQVRVAVGRHADVEEVDDVRVAGHLAGGVRLAEEPPLVVLAVQRPMLDLDRDRPADRLLPGLVDRRVAAPGQHRKPGQPGHGRHAQRRAARRRRRRHASQGMPVRAPERVPDVRLLREIGSGPGDRSPAVRRPRDQARDNG